MIKKAVDDLKKSGSTTKKLTVAPGVGVVGPPFSPIRCVCVCVGKSERDSYLAKVYLSKNRISLFLLFFPPFF